jgi:CBS-domain-containing membrane protein
MIATAKPALALTAADIMSREVVTVPHHTTVRDAAALLRRARVSGAPVVDDQGRCVGALSSVDFLRWAEGCAPDEANGPVATCPYQAKGRLLTGEAAVICTLAVGSCPLQSVRPTTAGRHATLCLQPTGALSDWQYLPEDRPGESVRRYMTTDLVIAGPRTPLRELARVMVDAHVHRVFVLDERGRPVGVISSTDVLAAVARDWLGPESN